ncbi:hypothetical protein BGX31_004694, partial [Mortierella sp. GBA43]
MDKYDDIVRIATDTQETITNIIDELCCLAQKTTLVVASGELYGDNIITPMPFDIKQLFPQSFEFRTDVDRRVNVAPIPDSLQPEIEAGLKRPKSQHDLAHLLSQDHLQYLYSHFISPNRERNVTKEQSSPAGEMSRRGMHPEWQRAADSVRSHSSTSNIPLPEEGLRSTVSEHIRQLATAMGNLWGGNIYRKSLDYLLRILLRLHLAPNRESSYWNRTHNTDRNTKKGKGSKGARKKWKVKVKNTCDRLAQLISRNANERAIDAVLASLGKIATQRPAAIQSKIPNIEWRLAEIPSVAKEIDERPHPNEDEEADDEEQEDGDDCGDKVNAMECGKPVIDEARNTRA